MDNEKFGKFIKELRKQKNMTQKELAEKLNITDKAISKWERGLSFPDISMLNLLAETFEITVSELLNAEIGVKKEIDIEKAVNEAVEKVTHKTEKREKRIKNVKRITGIISFILFIIFSIIQLVYIFLIQKHNYEYVIDILYYLINEIIILSGMTVLILGTKKIKLKKTKIFNIGIILISLILTTINIAFMCNNGFKNECIVSFSSDFSNELVLKKNKETGETTLYSYTKFLIFSKPKEKFAYSVPEDIKVQWLTNDICSVTYKDTSGALREFVATYGDRGNGITYNYVTTALRGEWQVYSQYDSSSKIIADTNGITVKKYGESQLFKYDSCEQFGTIALVLYESKVPKYIIALNEDCEIDDKTGFIKKNGTITLCEVSMEKTVAEELYCITYKDNEDLSNYKLTSVEKNGYSIKNGILYISYDGITTIEVPGDFTNMSSVYNEYNYQISEEKTVFYYNTNSKRYLVYSDDMGENWNTVEIESVSKIQNLQFVSSNVGFMLEFLDVAMGTAFGRISKTTDGGATWEIVSYGIGNENDGKVFKTSSQIKFIDENIGFLTMPLTSGESCDLYITKDGGNTFSKLDIIENDIYDYYHLPTQEDGKIYIKITQGTDGDSGEYKIYYSNDNGNEWKLIE